MKVPSHLSWLHDYYTRHIGRRVLLPEGAVAGKVSYFTEHLNIVYDRESSHPVPLKKYPYFSDVHLKHYEI